MDTKRCVACGNMVEDYEFFGSDVCSNCFLTHDKYGRNRSAMKNEQVIIKNDAIMKDILTQSHVIMTDIQSLMSKLNGLIEKLK